jgi:hypothetical protein
MRRALLLAGALAVSVGTAASAREDRRGAGMLPPEIASQFESAFLAGFGERPLWRPEARRGYRSRLRLTITGILYTRASIRIDERGVGLFEGHMIFVDPRDRSVPFGRTETRFSVSRAQMERLRAAIGEARMFTLYPEFWRSPNGDDICVDGMELIFERIDADGYRFSTANAQCNAPAAMRRAALILFQIARAPELERWLR